MKFLALPKIFLRTTVLRLRGHVAKQGLNLTLNDESGCCIVFLDRRWIELMSVEKKYNRHTIGL